MDFDAVRTFVAVADAGQFQETAAELSITQQAVSKRIAALERNLGVRLFTRTPRGAELTIDGQAFLPHARELLRAAERAVAAVRPGSRPLRVDVIASRLATTGLVRGFHQAHPEIELDVMKLFDVETAVAALRSGAIDASFRAVAMPGRPLPEEIATVRVLDEPLQLLTGPAHALASARSVTVAQLAGHRIWMPGITPGTEWAAYYDDLAAEFGLVIEATGPNLGADALLDTVADTPRAGHLHRRTDPSRLARQPRATPHPGDRSHPGLPTLAALASRQSPPGPGRPPRSPRRHGRPRHPRYLDPELDVAAIADANSVRPPAGAGVFDAAPS
ncbi:LysR family transcriptional regulator [Actinoplanes lobatus]|uniref:DNA-binding transcriptional LysR family regulator n=1 Tax=Actinoplanes lobatus TaxID=113568 RepID=A0A7W7HLQ6_9ACTN|nr:LysR family transcriptional regulator [Actinoplanes lobatus]MBB4752863.1 DNA-binding transcriptional LysR family regulator [Actinoplanes lobatus]GGN88259.1 LysR family transcriptional regulator [Actinoplanes lobatus]GIE39472.1 LysR family transcriptional regulator [Actinoplanes lobatus]